MRAALPVAYYLRDLSGEPAQRGDGTSEMEIRVQDAHARGVLEGRAAAQAEHDADLAGQIALFEQKLAAERQRWSTEEGVHLGDLIATAMDDLERRIAEQVSRILRPVLAEEVRNRAVARLAQELSGMLAKGDYAKITVSGPRDLLDALEVRLAGGRGGLSFVAADTADLVVSADDTILETRIGAWVRALDEDIAGMAVAEAGAARAPARGAGEGEGP